MQAQQFAAALPPDYYDALHPPLSDQYFPSDDASASNFSANSFSRGSTFTYPHQDYRYSLDRGELTSRLCAPGLVDSTFDATGLGFAGNASSAAAFVAPEDISVYQQQTWDWTGLQAGENAAYASAYPRQQEPDFFGPKGQATTESALRSPVAQLPTPAAMAVLLNPNGRSEGEPSPIGYSIPPGSALVASRPSATTTRPTRLVEPLGSSQECVPESLSREKKHACTMCHKRWARPSAFPINSVADADSKSDLTAPALYESISSYIPEKRAPFVCDTCGRRFGVASNLNRHVKRCILKPVNTPSPPTKSTSESPSAATESPNTSAALSPVISTMSSQESNPSNPPTSSVSRTVKRTRASGHPTANSPVLTDHQTSASASLKAKSSNQKRRRRAPSPSQWVPGTLQNFNLLSEDSYRVPAVPLPPVRRNPPKEERDSWDENVGIAPYHPREWSGVLPGPGLGHGLGLGGKDVRNLGLGGRGGFMLGRVLVF